MQKVAICSHMDSFSLFSLPLGGATSFLTAKRSFNSANFSGFGGENPVSLARRVGGAAVVFLKLNVVPLKQLIINAFQGMLICELLLKT